MLLVEPLAADTKACVLATTPALTSRGAMEIGVSPENTWKVTLPWPWPAKFGGWYLASM